MGNTGGDRARYTASQLRRRACPGEISIPPPVPRPEKAVPMPNVRFGNRRARLCAGEGVGAGGGRRGGTRGGAEAEEPARPGRGGRGRRRGSEGRRGPDCGRAGEVEPGGPGEGRGAWHPVGASSVWELNGGREEGS